MLSARHHTLSALLSSVALSIFAILLSLLCWDQIPEPMPIHWDQHGHPNGYAPRIVGLTLMPALTLLLPLLIALFARIEPRREHVARSQRALSTILVSCAAFSFALHAIILRAAMSADQSLSLASLLMLIGALFLLLGNVMPKLGSNSFAGVRTPWALSDERIWRKTQRLGGGMFVLTGLVTILATLLIGASSALLALFVVCALLSAAIPALYSYLLWRERDAR